MPSLRKLSLTEIATAEQRPRSARAQIAQEYDAQGKAEIGKQKSEKWLPSVFGFQLSAFQPWPRRGNDLLRRGGAGADGRASAGA